MLLKPLPLLVCVFVAAGPTLAGIGDEPFSLRVPLSLGRVSSFTDVIAREASVAHPLGSSVNPATVDVLRAPPFDYTTVVTASTNQAVFESGAWLTGFSTTGSVRLPDAGTLQAIYVRTDTQTQKSRTPTDFALRSNEGSFNYGRRISDAFSLGGGVHFVDSSLDTDTPFISPVAGPVRQQTKSDSFGGDFTLGVWAALCKEFFVGLTGGAGWTSGETDTEVRRDAPHQRFLFGGHRHDSGSANNVRAGVGWRPSDQFGVYADGIFIHEENHDGTLDVGRAALGGEWFPVKFVALRMGGSIDTEAEATVSAGVGFYGIKHVPLELGYRFNAFPEVRQEFGRAHLVSLSVVLTF